MNTESGQIRSIQSIHIQGYRPFGDFQAKLSSLEVIVGANGSGKSSLFEFLRFLRESVLTDIPPEIVPGSIGQVVFHRPGPDRFGWQLDFLLDQTSSLAFQAVVYGPVGRINVPHEAVFLRENPSEGESPFDYLIVNNGQGFADGAAKGIGRQRIALTRPNQLALMLMSNPDLSVLYKLRDFIARWRCYGAPRMDLAAIRRSVPIEQDPVLHEDCGNLSAVLFYLFSEHSGIFNELKARLRLAIPGFHDLAVKARGGPGEVIAFWQEDGVDSELTLADLSDGILHFLCWSVLCLVPHPPSLICIDEPDQGVHPRALPILAGMLQKASQRTQVFVATHSSYFLSQFDLSSIGVMKKVNGESRYLKPANSAVLQANLEEFGSLEIESMHRSEEMEAFAPESPRE